MKKLELKLDELRVETFEIEEREAERRTVVGLEDTSNANDCLSMDRYCVSTNQNECCASMWDTCYCNSEEWACVDP